jgi:hypothetical protein
VEKNRIKIIFKEIRHKESNLRQEEKGNRGLIVGLNVALSGLGRESEGGSPSFLSVKLYNN